MSWTVIGAGPTGTGTASTVAKFDQEYGSGIVDSAHHIGVNARLRGPTPYIPPPNVHEMGTWKGKFATGLDGVDEQYDVARHQTDNLRDLVETTDGTGYLLLGELVTDWPTITGLLDMIGEVDPDATRLVYGYLGAGVFMTGEVDTALRKVGDSAEIFLVGDRRVIPDSENMADYAGEAYSAAQFLTQNDTDVPLGAFLRDGSPLVNADCFVPSGSVIPGLDVLGLSIGRRHVDIDEAIDNCLQNLTFDCDIREFSTAGILVNAPEPYLDSLAMDTVVSTVEAEIDGSVRATGTATLDSGVFASVFLPNVENTSRLERD